MTALSGCTVKQQRQDPGDFVCDAPGCADAGVEPSASGDLPLNFPDATAEVEPSSEPAGDNAAAATAVHPVCMGACVLDDMLACRLERDILGTGLQESASSPNGIRSLKYPQMSLQLSGSLDAGSERLADAGAPEVAVESDAGVLVTDGPQPVDASVNVSEPDTTAPVPGGSDSSDASVTGASQGPELDASGVSDVSLSPGETDTTVKSCQLLPQDGEWTPQCAKAGVGDVGAACSSSADCSPGLGCVGQGDLGRCLRYCCTGDAYCGDGRFCAERALHAREPAPSDPLMVPVCVAAEKCDLSEPFPCPPGAECMCGPGTACTIVDATGVTACLPPQGVGKQDDACPCAAGYFCSESTQTCLQLCEVEGAAMDGTERVTCGEGASCSTNSRFPEGWGLCVTLGDMSAP